MTKVTPCPMCGKRHTIPECPMVRTPMRVDTGAEERLDHAMDMLRRQRDAAWVSVADMLPERNTAVIVCCLETDDGEGPWIGGGFWVPEGWQSQDSCMLDKPIAFTVTHWMPLPSPPGARARRSTR